MKKILTAALLTAVLLFIAAGSQNSEAATVYSAGSLLQTGDVKSVHILNGTIADADVSATANVSATKVAPRGTTGTVLLTDGTKIATTTGLRYATSTGDLYIDSGRVHASSTNFGGVNYSWPSADGSNGQVLTTNGSGSLSWVAGAGTYLVTTLTAGEDIAKNDALFVEDATIEDMIKLTTVSSTNDDVNNAFGVSTTDASHRLGAQAAQGINESTAKSVDKITVYIAKQGTPADNVQIALQADSSGTPSGTDIASGSVSGASLTTTAAAYTITLDTRATLAANTQYWVVYRRSGATDNTNYYRVGGLVYSSTYSGGALYYHESGTTWAASTDGRDTHVDLIETTVPGYAYRASAAIAKYSTAWIGFARAAAAQGATVDITVGGAHATFGNLATGTPYYLANASGTIATSAGTVSRKSCLAISWSTCIITNMW